MKPTKSSRRHHCGADRGDHFAPAPLWPASPAHLPHVESTGDEIVENLHRKELTYQERAEQTTEYADLVNRDRQTAQLGRSGYEKQERGDSLAARTLGVTRQEVSRARKVAGIAPEAKAAAREAGIDNNQRALLRVAAAPAEKQVEVVADLAAKRDARPGIRSGGGTSRPCEPARADRGGLRTRGVCYNILRQRQGERHAGERN